MDDLDRVLAAWELFPGSTPWPPPATPEQFAEVDRAIGRPLPRSLRRIYERADGLRILEGNLQFESTAGRAYQGLGGMSEELRARGWLIPDQVLMFGGNGSDEVFGLWCPDQDSTDVDPPAVMVGMTLKPACLALVGSRFSRFLMGWTAYYMVLLNAPGEAFEVLGLRGELQESDLESISPYFAWADPDLPDPDPDPYVRGHDAAGIAQLVTRIR